MTDTSILPFVIDDVNHQTMTVLKGYPKNFFNINTGKGPKDEFEAAKFWQYRKARPASNYDMYNIPPSGMEMLLEMNSIRTDLRAFVSTELLYGIITCCKILNITMPSNNQSPLLHKDMMEIISVWSPNTTMYQRLIYMIFHQFHKSRKWLSTVVDKFLHENNMYIIEPTTAVAVKKNIQIIEEALVQLLEEQKHKRYVNICHFYTNSKNG